MNGYNPRHNSWKYHDMADHRHTWRCTVSTYAHAFVSLSYWKEIVKFYSTTAGGVYPRAMALFLFCDACMVTLARVTDIYYVIMVGMPIINGLIMHHASVIVQESQSVWGRFIAERDDMFDLADDPFFGVKAGQHDNISDDDEDDDGLL